VRLIQSLQRPDSEELAVAAGAEEGDGRIEKVLDVQGVDACRRCHLSCKRQMPLQQGANIVDARIVGCNDESHTCRLTNEGESLQLLTNKANRADASRLLSGILERAGGTPALGFITTPGRSGAIGCVLNVVLAVSERAQNASFWSAPCSERPDATSCAVSKGANVRARARPDINGTGPCSVTLLPTSDLTHAPLVRIPYRSA
jgi:hypothetical protein